MQGARGWIVQGCSRSGGRAAATVLGSMLALAVEARPSAVPRGDWWTIDRDLAGTRYPPLDEIRRDNLGSLIESWRFETGGNSTGGTGGVNRGGGALTVFGLP